MEVSAALFIVTGVSGAGKSTVLSALEDNGFLCVDNIPLELLGSFFSFITQHNRTKSIALGIDVRSGSNMELITQELMRWKQHIPHMRVVFLYAQLNVLVKRFEETRRNHPLSGAWELHAALQQEQILLEPLRAIADSTVDTTHVTMQQLRLQVRDWCINSQQPTLLVTLTSFGFKYGNQPLCNFMYDIRALPNPYFTKYKELDGKHPELQEYFFGLPEVQEYWQRFVDFFIFSLERSYHEGRFFLHIGIGCTGGRHRSVAFVERCAQLKIEKVRFFVHHKDINASSK